MTIEEILKAQGIEDGTVKKILADMKTNKVFTAGEENLDVRYGKLKTDHDGKLAELAEAQKLIDEMKKGTKDNEGLQTKITAYESQMKQMQAELNQTKIDAAVKVKLLSNKALDVDYLTFKLKEKGELALDDKGEIKGWDDKIMALKTQFPTQFETKETKKYDEKKLPDHDEGGKGTVTKEAFDKMGYKDRLKLIQENPETYHELQNKEG